MRTALLPALAVAALLPLVLSGCGVADVLQKQTSGTAEDVTALDLAWSSPAAQPGWIPPDATGIRYVAATSGAADAAPATVRVTTTSALPEDCVEVERRSLDSYGPDWAPKRFPDRVERCGDWAVMAVTGGYFAWTPLAPAERAEQAAPRGG